MTSASKDATIIAIAVASGFGIISYTLFEVFAPDAPFVGVAVVTFLPLLLVAVADLVAFGDRGSVAEPAEVPE